jgi:hypothetical protein
MGKMRFDVDCINVIQNEMVLTLFTKRYALWCLNTSYLPL